MPSVRTRLRSSSCDPHLLSDCIARPLSISLSGLQRRFRRVLRGTESLPHGVRSNLPLHYVCKYIISQSIELSGRESRESFHVTAQHRKRTGFLKYFLDEKCKPDAYNISEATEFHGPIAIHLLARLNLRYRNGADDLTDGRLRSYANQQKYSLACLCHSPFQEWQIMIT